MFQATLDLIGVGVDARIRAELIEFIVANYFFGDTTRVLRDNDSLVEEGVIDSTGILELIEFIESHFGIEVSEDETVPENLGSISGLTRFVVNKLPVSEPALWP
jgi:acyl carrier protein